MTENADFSRRKQMMKNIFPEGKTFPIQIPLWLEIELQKEENHQKVEDILRAYA